MERQSRTEQQGKAEQHTAQTAEKPDIILVLSDQHNGLYTSLPEAGKANTPFLASLARAGAVFTRAYCNAPLCVPSRCSFLTGKLPHELEIYDNDSLLPENVPTIAHAMALAGYETVLAGRMHFKGQDQNHGFERRLVGDITTQFWGEKRTDLGDFAGTLQAAGCQKAAGFGPSPVLEYDEAVVKAACEELSRDGERPLFLVVGLYAPHFPYVAPEEEFFQCVDSAEDVSDMEWKAYSCYRPLIQPVTEKRTRTVRAAYRAMIGRLDSQISELYGAYRRRTGKKGVFIYTSDHGDQLGRRGIFGKKTMYEDSVRVPLVIEDGIHRGERRDQAVSLIDLTRTLLDYAGTGLPGCRGVNLFEENRPPVEIEGMADDGSALIKAVIEDENKLLHLPEGDRLCVWSEDEREETDFSSDRIDECSRLKRLLLSREEEMRLLNRYRSRSEETRIIKEWGRQAGRSDTARFALSPASVSRPEPYRGIDEANGGPFR